MALFIWFAENIGTFTSAWIYPSQRHGWSLGALRGKLGYWYLLILAELRPAVTLVHPPRGNGRARASPPTPLTP